MNQRRREKLEFTRHGSGRDHLRGQPRVAWGGTLRGHPGVAWGGAKTGGKIW